MRTVIVGLGIQGEKRREVAGNEVVAIVDPIKDGADHVRLEDVPLSDYDAALLCTPDTTKIALMDYLLSSGKHVLAEKPVIGDEDQLRRLDDLAKSGNLACYTAYNHRYEPSVKRLEQILEAGELGTIYNARLFYGNGTARNVRESPWRDVGSGVLRDLGSHLLDLALHLFSCADQPFRLSFARRFENHGYDYAAFTVDGPVALQFEVSLLSWRNDFTIDVWGEFGSAHVRSLCKWGGGEFILRRRVLPSGRPEEERQQFDGPDPTWQREYEVFKALCDQPRSTLEKDIWIDATLRGLLKQTGEMVEL